MYVDLFFFSGLSFFRGLNFRRVEQYIGTILIDIQFSSYHMQGSTLEQLLKSSDYISQLLDQLKTSLTETTQNLYGPISDPGQSIEKAIDLKGAFRFLVQGIETNRALVQVQKEQIEKKKVFLEGLHYYKATLKTQIATSQVDLTSVKEYIEEQPSPQTDWIQDYPLYQKKVLTTLQQFKQRKKQYHEKQLKKQQLTKEIATSQQKYKKTFPQQVKKLYTQVAQTSKVFNIKQIDPHSLTQFRSKKIEQIHSLLYPLKLKQCIDLKHLNHFDCEELQITIQKGSYGQYEYARQNKIMIEEKPIRFSIATVHRQENKFDKQEVMAVAISRREEFTTEEIFNNLFMQQKVKPIYANPISQAQRNTNNKYSQLNWIGDILGSPSSLISGNQFIEKIKHRIFTLNLIKFALETISKKLPPYFFTLFKPQETASKQTSFPLIDSKKIFISQCEKTTFEEYKKEVYIPEWVFKALDNYEIIKREQHKLNKYSLTALDAGERQLLNSFIEHNHLEELEVKDFYWYYKFELTADKNVLNGFILVPSEYPQRRSMVKLISFKKSSESHQNLQMPKHSQLRIQNDESEMRIRCFSEELVKFQTQLNQKIDSFLYKTSQNGSVSSQQSRKKEPFIIYFQINRIISLMLEKSLQQN